MFIQNYFNLRSTHLLIFLFFCVSVSIFLFQQKKIKSSLFFLILSSLTAGFFISTLDPFLHIWDEQYHALVAKNLIGNWLKPTLFSSPILKYNFQNWSENYIWLHKQPLFLWQIALSIKLFGVNELAVRIPSIFLHTLTTIIIVRIGSIIKNTSTGFYGALFFCISYYSLALVTGKFATDHNDTAFLFYVTASFWAWLEFKNTNNKKWLFLIGLFSGLAVLVKWLMGLIVFLVWFCSDIIENKNKYSKIVRPIFISFAISLCVFLPWQIYCHFHYPIEYNFEMTMNSSHLFKSIENHSGNIFFHWNAMKEIYGSGILVRSFFLLGLILLLLNKSTSNKIGIFSFIFFTYLIYSVAATKMTGYCFIAAPFFFIGLGSLLDDFIEFLKCRINKDILLRFVSFILILSVSFFLFNLTRIEHYYSMKLTDDNLARNFDLKLMESIQKIKKENGKNTIVFSSTNRLNSNISIMFYTGLTTYNRIPSVDEIDFLVKNSYRIIVLTNVKLPTYIKQTSSLIIIFSNN